ncbi:MAG: FAD:protein FMN transferase [Christensenellales bacterium]|jgi:thiamine biosynthesis lipoprotein
MWRRFRCVCALGLAIGLLLSGCQPQPLTKSAYALDTYCAVTLQGGREATLDSAMGLLTYYDNLFSATRQGSDIYRLNHAQGQPVAVNQETYELLAFCIQMHALSDGAFDITLYPVSQLWDFKSGAAALPDQQDIARALTRRGMDQIHLLPDGQVQLSGGAQIDLGGVAKGYIGMRMAEQIGQDGSVASGVLDLGGNIQCLGEKADGAPFVVGIKDPLQPERLLGRVQVPGGVAVITSGVYERGFDLDGVRYHHLLDPQTGYPARSGLAAVTVVCGDGAMADALSTALFVLGEERAAALLERLEGVEALLVREDGSVRATAGLAYTPEN